MMEGDSYPLPIKISANGVCVTKDNASNVEIVLGKLVKTYKSGDVSFDDENNVWLFPLSQAETFSLPSSYNVQVRVKFKDGTVIGKDLGNIRVTKSMSKEVL